MISGLNYVFVNRRTSKANLSRVKSFWIRSAGVRTSTDEGTERPFSFTPWVRNRVRWCVCVCCLCVCVRVIPWFAFIHINLYLICKTKNLTSFASFRLFTSLLRFACSPSFFWCCAGSKADGSRTWYAYWLLQYAGWCFCLNCCSCLRAKAKELRKVKLHRTQLFRIEATHGSNLLLPLVARKNLYFNS